MHGLRVVIYYYIYKKNNSLLHLLLKSPYLCVGHIHPSGIKPVFDLLSIVDLEQVIASKLHLCQLLVVLKEVYWECHLTRGPGG